MGQACVTEDSMEWVTTGKPRIQCNGSRLSYSGFKEMGHACFTKYSMEWVAPG